MRKVLTLIGAVALFGLAACDETNDYIDRTSDAERAAVGAVAGCIAGEILRDGECVTGAAIGAAGGALANEIN